MKKEYAYFCVQMKRGCKILPRHLLVNLLVCVCMGVLAFLFLERGILSEGRQKYRIGIVGNVTDTYLGFGISALQSLDDSRYVIDLVEMSGKEAEQAFHKVAAVESGANDKLITYVVSEGQKGIASIVMQEIVDVASDLVTRSQSAVFAMQEILVAHDRRDILLKATEDLNLYLIELVLSRSGLCEVEELGMAEGLVSTTASCSPGEPGSCRGSWRQKALGVWDRPWGSIWPMCFFWESAFWRYWGCWPWQWGKGSFLCQSGATRRQRLSGSLA